MNTISLKLNKDDLNKLKTNLKEYIVSNNNEYIDTMIKVEDCTISIYTNDKVVFQGKDAFVYASGFIPKKENDQAGSDEVGTGDYFGPVCVCACIVLKEDLDFLKQYQICDSKKLSDTKILELAPILMSKLKYSLLILDNEKYNHVQRSNHMVQIKTKMHNQAYINLIHKGYKLPKACYVDQFVAKDTYFRYLADEKEVFHDLIFETKAEDKYISVACASIIARYAFIKSMEKLEKTYDMVFHKGAGTLVDEDAKKYVEKYGFNNLYKVAKLHFKNTEKIKANAK